MIDYPHKSKLLRRLKNLYGEGQSELCFKNTFQLLVSVMLSAQSTDKKVNQITPNLFQDYPDYQTLANAQITSLERLIREVNYYKTKSRHLKLMAKMVLDKFNGKLPEKHGELITLPGVGNKTANVVLSELGLDYTFPVDTHVFRVSRRIGLSDATTREKVEFDLKAVFNKKYWRNLHHWLIFHGRRVCTARNPKCEKCTLYDICLKKSL